MQELEDGHKAAKPTPSRVSVVVSFEIVPFSTFNDPLISLLQAKSDKSTYEVWLSSSDRHSIKFIDSFYREYHYLEKNAKMEIRTVVNEHINYAPYDKERENCLSGGRYCSTHPSTDKSHFGRDNLMEDLRQHCIAEKRMDKFHDYIEKFGEKCFESTQMAACSEQNMKNLGITVNDIIKCVNDTFVAKVTGAPNYYLDDNTYLKKEVADRRSKGISHWPTAFVNGIAIRVIKITLYF